MVERGSLTHSPLARPDKLIHGLAAAVQEYLYYPDPQPLYVTLGTVAANMMRGYPVWLMLIGPPSSGKTTVLDMLVDIPRLHLANNITGPAALLSGTAKKERSKDATGGLMNRIGLRGMIVMEDFSSILSMQREPMKELIAAFRLIFDGRLSREVGTDGGKTLAWGMSVKGRVGFLGACTPAIDAHYQAVQELGERWLYYRFPAVDGISEGNAALGHLGSAEEMDLELRDLVRGFFGAIGLDWDNVEPRALNIRERSRLTAMAALMTVVRTSVSRDYRTHEIDGIVAPEGTMRMAKCLKQLYLGLEQIGLGDGECWAIIGKVVLDSAPQLRVKVVDMLREADKGLLLVEEISERLQCGQRTVERLVGGVGLGDLEVLGVVRRWSGGDGAAVTLTEWAKRLLEVGWGEDKHG